MNLSAEILGSTIIGFILGAGLLYVLRSATIKKYKKQSLTDELTGLYNAREFSNRFIVELERSKRYKVPFSILLIDVDKFKKVNDTYGYKTGDNLLCELTEEIRNQLRISDVLFRYKMGDEFMIMALNTDKKGAEKLVLRIKESIRNHNFLEQKKISVTVSIGVSEFDSTSPEKNMEIDAEQNLKKDKLM